MHVFPAPVERASGSQLPQKSSALGNSTGRASSGKRMFVKAWISLGGSKGLEC